MHSKFSGLAFAIICLSLGACGRVDQQASQLSRPVTPGQTMRAGVGDAVVDLRLTQPLPNAFGKADIFGRTKDTGRVVVRYLGAQGERAYFSRQDILINGNETTMTRAGYMPVTATQQSVATGYVGNVPVSGYQTTTGVGYVPTAPATSFATNAGQIQLSAPVGGSFLVEGTTVSILRIADGSVEYALR